MGGGGYRERGARGSGRATGARGGGTGGTGGRADPVSRSARGQSEEWNAAQPALADSAAPPTPPATPPPAEPRVLGADAPELAAGLTPEGRESLALLRRTLAPEAMEGFLRSVQRTGEVDFPALEAGLARRRASGERVVQEARRRIEEIDTAVGELVAHTGPGRGALGDGSTEAAAMAEIASGEPTRGRWHGDAAEATVHALRGHVDELRRRAAQAGDPALTARADRLIARAEDRLEALEPAAIAWAQRRSTHPTLWTADGESQAHPETPVGTQPRPITAPRPRTSARADAPAPGAAAEPAVVARPIIPVGGHPTEPEPQTPAAQDAPPAVVTRPIIPVGGHATEPESPTPAATDAPHAARAVVARPTVRVGTPATPRPAPAQDDTPVVLPTGASPEETTSVRPLNQIPLGGSGATATVTHNSVQVQAPTGGEGNSAQVGGQLERGADGDVRGVTMSGGVTRGRGEGRSVSGQISGGGTYYAEPPQRSTDGSWRVSWRVALRIGAEGGIERGTRSGSVGGQVERAREGVDVFSTFEAATEFQQSFRTWDANAIASRFFNALTGEQGTVDFWRRAPLGTSRTVAIGGQLSASASARLGGLVSVGLGVQWTPTESSQVEKESAESLKVTQQYQSERIVNPTVGAAGLSVSGSLGLVDNGRSYTVTDVVNVNLTTGQRSLTRFLSAHGPLEPGQAGVTFTSHTVEQGRIDQSGAGLIVASVETRSQTSTVTETSGTGAARQTRVTHRGLRRGRADSGSTTYLDSDQLDAPEAERNYQYAGERRGPGEDGQSRSWRIAEEFTQAQMRQAHQRYLENSRASHGDRAGSGFTCYDSAYRQLARVPTTAAGDAERARIFAELVAADGDRAMTVLRSLAGGPASRALRLFTAGVEDANFLSAEQRTALEGRLSAVDTRLQAWERQDPRPAVEASLLFDLRREIDGLRGRLAAIRDGSQYTDMPVPREQVVADYQGLLDRAEGLLRRATGADGAGPPSGLSEAGYAAWYEMDAARQRTTRERTHADRAEREALSLRNHMSAATTGAAMTTGAARMTTARAAQTRAEDALRAATPAAGVARESAYRTTGLAYGDAAQGFAEAAEAYEQAIARVRLEMAQAAAPRIADGITPAADSVPSPDGRPREGAPMRAADLRSAAVQAGFPQVDLARALARHARAAAASPRAAEHLRAAYSGEVSPALVPDPEQRAQVEDVLAVCWYQQRHGLTVDGQLGGETLRAVYGEAGGDAALQAEGQDRARREAARGGTRAESPAAPERVQYHFDRVLSRLREVRSRGLAASTYEMEPEGPVDVGGGLTVRVVRAFADEVRGAAGGLVGPGRQVIRVEFAIVAPVPVPARTLTLTQSRLVATDDTLQHWVPQVVHQEEIPIEPGRRFSLTFNR